MKFKRFAVATASTLLPWCLQLNDGFPAPPDKITGIWITLLIDCRYSISYPFRFRRDQLNSDISLRISILWYCLGDLHPFPGIYSTFSMKTCAKPRLFCNRWSDNALTAIMNDKIRDQWFIGDCGRVDYNFIGTILEQNFGRFDRTDSPPADIAQKRYRRLYWCSRQNGGYPCFRATHQGWSVHRLIRLSPENCSFLSANRCRRHFEGGNSCSGKKCRPDISM